jgi:hypothetical protein
VVINIVQASGLVRCAVILKQKPVTEKGDVIRLLIYALSYEDYDVWFYK